MPPGAGTGAATVEAPVHVARHTIFTVVVLGLVVYLVIPQLGKLPEAWDAIRHADVAWLVVGALATAATFAAGAVQLTGATDRRLALTRTTLAQLAASFANKLTPASIGGLGVRVRFLLRSGLDSAGAVASVTLDTVAGGVVHFVWFLLAILFAGGAAFDDDVTLPDGWIVLAGVVLVLATSGVIVFLPATRRWITERGLPAFRALGSVIRRPAKAVRLLGGAVAQTGCLLLAFGASLAAVGAGTPVGTLMIVYLGGSTVAAAAPTPGGLGAVEAALVAGLTATGTPTDLAVAGVIVFRTLTYWATLLPGWLALHALRRAGSL
jgi:undecaprenyl-diphosphatase